MTSKEQVNCPVCWSAGDLNGPATHKHGAFVLCRAHYDQCKAIERIDEVNGAAIARLVELAKRDAVPQDGANAARDWWFSAGKRATAELRSYRECYDATCELLIEEKAAHLRTKEQLRIERQRNARERFMRDDDG